MNLSDQDQFRDIMVALADHFSSKISQMGIELRFKALSRFSIDQIKEAALFIMETRKYTTVPTVADFVDAIEGNPLETAQLQADLFMQVIRNIGSCQNPELEDPITRHIVYDKIGLNRIRHSYSNEWPFMVRDFKDSYVAYNSVSKNKLLKAPEQLKMISNKVSMELDMRPVLKNTAKKQKQSLINNPLKKKLNLVKNTPEMFEQQRQQLREQGLLK